MSDVRWFPGRGSDVPAEVVVGEVKALIAEHGMAPPAMLVERARPETSPLHSLFTWDNDEAAEKFRLVEARSIVRSVRVTLHEQEVVAPAFVSVKRLTSDGQQQGYVEVLTAMTNRSMREQIVKDALRQLRAWQKRYKHLTELAGIFAALEKAEDEDAAA